MKRRLFFWRAAASTLALSQNTSAQMQVARTMLRTSRLFSESTPIRDHLVQDILTLNDTIICLHGNTKTREWKVTGTAADGARRWEYMLPIGIYSAIGFTDGGSTLLIHAFGYKDGPRFRGNCILCLRPDTGALELLGSTDVGGSARMFSAGDSYLVRFTDAKLQIWRVDENINLAAIVPLAPGMSGTQTHVDLISPTEVAITARDGSAVSSVSLPFGRTQDFVLMNSEIVQARSLLQEITSGQAVANSGAMAAASILAVTGGDPLQGCVYALVLPVAIGKPTPLLSIDTHGVTSTVGLYDVNHRLAAKKLIRATADELGVLYGDGTVGWYPLV